MFYRKCCKRKHTVLLAYSIEWKEFDGFKEADTKAHAEAARWLNVSLNAIQKSLTVSQRIHNVQNICFKEPVKGSASDNSFLFLPTRLKCDEISTCCEFFFFNVDVVLVIAYFVAIVVVVVVKRKYCLICSKENSNHVQNISRIPLLFLFYSSNVLIILILLSHCYSVNDKKVKAGCNE